MYKNSIVDHMEYTHYAHYIFLAGNQVMSMMFEIQMLKSFMCHEVNLVSQTTLRMFVK